MFLLLKYLKFIVEVDYGKWLNKERCFALGLVMHHPGHNAFAVIANWYYIPVVAQSDKVILKGMADILIVYHLFKVLDYTQPQSF